MDFLTTDSLPAKKVKRDLEHELVPALTTELGETTLDLSRRGLTGKSSTAESVVYRLTKKFGKEVLNRSIRYFMEHKSWSDDLQVLMQFLNSVLDNIDFILQSKFQRPPANNWAGPLKQVMSELRKFAQDEAEIALSEYTSLESEVSLGDCRVAIGSLEFMQDAKLAHIVERDISELSQALKSGSIKTVMIMAGSIIEGLLLDALLSRRAEAEAIHTDKKLEYWVLDRIISVSEKLGILPYKTLEKLSDGLRDYRNLVHPGREIREKMRVAPEEARIAVDIVNILLRTFREKDTL